MKVTRARPVTSATRPTRCTRRARGLARSRLGWLNLMRASQLDPALCQCPAGHVSPCSEVYSTSKYSSDPALQKTCSFLPGSPGGERCCHRRGWARWACAGQCPRSVQVGRLAYHVCSCGGVYIGNSGVLADSLRVVLVEAGDLSKIRDWALAPTKFSNRVSSITNASRAFLQGMYMRSS